METQKFHKEQWRTVGSIPNMGGGGIYLIRTLFEIREECEGGEPGDGEQREKEASGIDMNVTYFLVLPRATPDSQKQLVHEDDSIKYSTSYLFLTRGEIIATT